MAFVVIADKAGSSGMTLTEKKRRDEWLEQIEEKTAEGGLGEA